MAGVIFTIEALLPLLLWTIAFNKARWEIYLAEQLVREPPTSSNSALVGEQSAETSQATARPASSDPIDGPHGWSGRSRYNARKLKGDDQ